MPGITDPAEEYFKDGVWAWVSNQWKKLVADASNFLQVNVAAQDIDVEIKQTAAADLTPGVCGWDGSAWRKLSLLWGYSDRYVDAVSATKSGDGNYQRDSTAVPAGYVYIVQSAGIHNQTGARGMSYLAFMSSSLAYYFAQALTPAKYELVGFTGQLILKEGDQLRWFQSTCLDSDNIRTYAWGYKMKVAE
jgi:hypothetical protein